MLKVAFSRVREDKVDDLRNWIKELGSREEEVPERPFVTSAPDTRVFLREGANGTILVYSMEIDGPERAHRAYRNSKLAIHHGHRDVMGEVLAGQEEVEELLNLNASRGR